MVESRLPAEEPWRIFRIMAEFVEGFDELSNVGAAVSIFGFAFKKNTEDSRQTPAAFMIEYLA